MDREPISGRRIIKHFDFNERPLQNNGTLPLNWRPYRGAGFPSVLEGRFDEKVGHASQPSFRLDLDGGSLAYQYEGNDIAVRPHSDYLIVAWVRTAGLQSSRAYVTAYFLDRKGNRIAGTEQATPLVGGESNAPEWQVIQVGLIGDAPGARYLGLSVWLTQQKMWDYRPRPLRAIEHEDVKVTAWFDDLTVYRLPRVALRSSHPGNLFEPQSPVVLLPEVTDPDGLNLVAKLTIHSVDGQVAQERAVRVHTASEAPEQVTFDSLPVGLYEARLDASTQGTPLVWRTLHFARLPERLSAPQTAGRGFGLILSQPELRALQAQHELLKPIRAEWVKMPVWLAQRSALDKTFDMTPQIDGYLNAIVDSGGNPVGIQMDDRTPSVIGAAGSMMDLLNEQPIAWKPTIAGLWSRYTGLIQVWQIGSDADDYVYLDDRLGSLLKTLRKEMSELMSEPTLATPCSVSVVPETPAFADYRVIRIPSRVMPGEFKAHVEPLLGGAPAKVWLTLEALPQGHYSRELSLSDLARRMAEAYFLRCGAVFVEAPWKVRTDLLTADVDPQEEYFLVRTLADVLGGTQPILRTTINGVAEAMLFDRNGQGVLFAWDDRAPAEGREHLLYLGDYAEQIDLWGRRIEMERVGNQHRIRIGPVPTLIVNTPSWLVEFRHRFRVQPTLLESTSSREKHEIIFRNTYREPISGMLRLFAPPSWDLRPTRMTFSLQPGEEFRQGLEWRLPVNAEAGVKAILGEFMLDADRRYQITTPAWFELGLQDIQLDTYAFRSNTQAVVRVCLTNNSKSPLSFDGDLIIPGRQRLSRLFQDIAPGQSVTKEFTIPDSTDLRGKRVRVHFNERQGERVWNHVLTLP